jgi:hypothetical protein
VALYFENSLLPPDLNLLPSAAAKVSRIERVGSKTVVESASGVGLPWQGAAMVDDLPWPVATGKPCGCRPGAHAVEAAKETPGLRIVRLNAELHDARRLAANCVEFSYKSHARAIAYSIAGRGEVVEMDGTDEPLELAGPEYDSAAARTALRDNHERVS